MNTQKIRSRSRAWWCTQAISASWEAQVGVRSQPGQNSKGLSKTEQATTPPIKNKNQTKKKKQKLSDWI